MSTNDLFFFFRLISKEVNNAFPVVFSLFNDISSLFFSTIEKGLFYNKTLAFVSCNKGSNYKLCTTITLGLPALLYANRNISNMIKERFSCVFSLKCFVFEKAENDSSLFSIWNSTLAFPNFEIVINTMCFSSSNPRIHTHFCM